VFLKDFQETCHSDFIPPAVPLHNHEDTSQDVSDIASSTNVRWKCAIRDSDEDGSSVIENNV